MKDLLLWRLLRMDTLPSGKLVPLLKELSTLPPNLRLSLFGLLDRVLNHHDAALRGEAVGALGGACGIPTWRNMVHALKDPNHAVRTLAVTALRRSAAFDPGRWVHAMFNSDPAVREEAERLGYPYGFASFFPSGCLTTHWESSAVDPEPPHITTVPENEFREIQQALEGEMNTKKQVILEAFLERGAMVEIGQRLKVAEHLARTGFAQQAFPVLLPAISYELCYAAPELLEISAKGIVALGSIDHERWLTDALYNRSWVADDQKALYVLLTQSSSVDTRYWARDRVVASTAQYIKLARLTRVFAWGVELGKYLTGKGYQLEMLVNDYDLGYTRLRENKLHITPLPILRGERNGMEVVRGLILHEYGHHLYHRGPEPEEIWKQADIQGLGRLLNLVADEHLERNLRQRSPRFGDLLKTLNAYAFQHNMREVDVRALLGYLGDRAPLVLPRVPLGAARKPGHVVVASGRILREMEAGGHSFARFMRALRMGLGNRTGDPKVAEALALFKTSFRKSTMPQLLDIARKLREIFGDEADMLNDFGLERALSGDEMEWLGSGAGITHDAVQRGIESLLKTEGKGDESQKAEGGPAQGLNLRPEEQFNPITKIEKVPHDPARHAEYARRVGRAARQLRRYFQDLGLGLRPERGRLQGRHFDRTRTRDLLLKGDPRILIARKMERHTDLFLGVIIDCSGSMAGDKMEKARLFGALLAEALNGQTGVDLRLFGFTDRVIYDAGTARRCAAHALNATDGNNDAAALWHAYRIAKASRRKAKLLVMISDGLPTECSVAALKSLVARLTRWHYCCAQVAVQPLEQICFPHYIVLQEQEFDVAVRKFGDVVMRLVGQALK